MIAEAVDTAITLGWALAAWIVLVSLAAALALHTVIAVVWWAGRTTWRALRGPRRGLQAPRSPSRDSSAAGTPERPPQSRSRRPVPSWAHTQPYTYEEAA